MTILVTGARGNIGARLIPALTKAGQQVRATARDLTTLPALPAGIETVELDLTDPVGAEKALSGVESVFLYPARGGIDGFLHAAHEAGVRYIVLLSSPASFEAHEHDSHIGLVHRAIERSLEDSGLPHTLLYPSWLATNAARDWAPGIRATGTVRLAFPDAQFNPIHLDDVAEVAAHLLTRDDHRARIQVLTGPESLRLREIVAILSEELGRGPIPIETLTRQQALAGRAPWMPEPVLEALLDAEAAAVDVAAPVNNAVERITGHQARTFRAWAQGHRADFTSS